MSFSEHLVDRGASDDPDAGELSPLEHEHHRSVQSGSFRAAVFGMSDGLVSNAALILGVAGADAGADVVRTAGVAGLVAGACSMAAGEYLSMRAQQDLLERELDQERRALDAHPDEEQLELQLLYEERGIPRRQARQLAATIMADPELALEVHAREEIGIDPDDLGNPIGAAASSFVAFVVGAFLPLIPWLVGSGTAAIVTSLVVAAVAAAGLGLAVAALGHGRYLLSATRHFVIAAGATLATFGIGSLFDVAT